MRRPPQAPDWTQHIHRVLSASHHPELIGYVRRMNARYYYWDKVQPQPQPLGLTAEEAWAAVKLSRLHRHSIPLLDLQGRPFTYWLPDDAYRTLHLIDRQGGGALTADPYEQQVLTEMRDRVLIDSLMEEAIATSQIEGAVTTRAAAKEMLRSGRAPRDHSERMIDNGYRTIQLIRDRRDQPLDINLLHEIQESMTRDTLDKPHHAGRFRTVNDEVSIVDVRDGEVIFVPHGADELPARLERLIDFANAEPESEPFVHPFVRAAILHFWLAYEHPYVDGNGRTARALFYWYMLKSGYWLFEYLTISRIIHNAPMRYYRAFLYSEADENDLTYFLMFQMDVARRALRELRRRLHEMAEQQARIQAVRLAAGLNPRQRAILDHAIRHPGHLYTFESHRRSHGVTYQTARTDLLGLLEKGFFSETGSRRPREFVPAADLRQQLGLLPGPSTAG